MEIIVLSNCDRLTEDYGNVTVLTCLCIYAHLLPNLAKVLVSSLNLEFCLYFLTMVERVTRTPRNILQGTPQILTGSVLL